MIETTRETLRGTHARTWSGDGAGGDKGPGTRPVPGTVLG
jgi:hypothetical protein